MGGRHEAVVVAVDHVAGRVLRVHEPGRRHADRELIQLRAPERTPEPPVKGREVVDSGDVDPSVHRVRSVVGRVVGVRRQSDERGQRPARGVTGGDDAGRPQTDLRAVCTDPGDRRRDVVDRGGPGREVPAVQPVVDRHDVPTPSELGQDRTAEPRRIALVTAGEAAAVDEHDGAACRTVARVESDVERLGSIARIVRDRSLTAAEVGVVEVGHVELVRTTVHAVGLGDHLRAIRVGDLVRRGRRRTRRGDRDHRDHHGGGQEPAPPRVDPRDVGVVLSCCSHVRGNGSAASPVENIGPFDPCAGAESGQLTDGSSGNRPWAAVRPPWRRITERHSESGSPHSTSSGRAATTCHAPAAISASS